MDLSWLMLFNSSYRYCVAIAIFSVHSFFLPAWISVFIPLHSDFDVIRDTVSISFNCVSQEPSNKKKKKKRKKMKIVLQSDNFPRDVTVTGSLQEDNSISGVVTVIGHSAPCMVFLYKWKDCIFRREIAKDSGDKAVHVLKVCEYICVCICGSPEVIVLKVPEGHPLKCSIRYL